MKLAALKLLSALVLLATSGLCLLRADGGRPSTPVHRSPQSICLVPGSDLACVANATSDSVSVFDVMARRVLREISVGRRPYQIEASADGHCVYVSCAWSGRIDVVDPREGRLLRSLPANLEPNAVVPLKDGRRLLVSHFASDEISVLDAVSGREEIRLPVGRQPRHAVEIPGSSRVLVSNNLGRSVTLVDLASGRVEETRDLGLCSMLRQAVCSADGRWAFVANLVSHDEAPTLQIERGWIHSNGFTVMDLKRPGHRVSFLLDHLIRGAANPTALALSRDGRRLYVSLAGVHEVALVEVPAILKLVGEVKSAEQIRRLQEDVEILERLKISRRVEAGGLGPRSLVLDEARGELLVANYFSDSISILDAETGALKASVELSPPVEPSLWRKGELLSCDARMCYQNWFSCVSCHQEDGTVDGLNWDLANDGLGNPKNAKDLINAHDTAPAMWGAVRADLNDGVAGGQRFEGFISDDERQKALMAYFGNPERAPNPWRGLNPEQEARGKKLFVVAGCDVCHPEPLYTDLKVHDLSMKGADDFRSRFDTPSLRGVYRTGPWLHDGSAATLETLFTEHNPLDVHGRTRSFSKQELADLIAYLRTL